MIITSGIINGGVVMEFSSAKETYRKMGATITDKMSDAEVLAAIEAFEDQPAVSSTPSTEERTAAALEYLAMASMPDASEE